MERSKIGFITGLAAEAKLLRGTGFLLAAGGGEPAGAARAAAALIAQGAQALVSFGLAGGLAKHLQPGEILVPDTVIEGPRSYTCDPALIAFLGGATSGAMLAGKQIAASPADKALLLKRNKKAVAIDLESGAVARAAAAHGLPFAVLRAVADSATRGLPPAALVPLTTDGGIDLPGILRAVAANPAQIPALLGLARDAGKARAALAKRIKGLPL